MCGINGWIDWKRDLTSQQQVLSRMTRTLIPRGPDAEGYWFSPHAAFGHRRLIVVDPQTGLQPMLRKRGEESYVLVYNGELYNTEDLRQELLTRGYQFEGHSDTEVLLLSYMEWGPACVEKFNGIFAFGIWDDKRAELFLARDRMGVKPLFYAEYPGALIFASELKALLKHPYIAPIVDAEGLSEIFLLGPARTPGVGIYKNVAELKPGHALIYKRNGVQVRQYWSLPCAEHTDDFPTTVAKVRELFLDTVKRQMVSDVPIGTLLSGGLDSSAITAIAAGTLARNGEGSLPTFSIDYQDNDRYFKPNDFQPNADAPWIERVSGYFGTEHHAHVIDTPELVEALQDATLARDLPGMADIDSSLLLFAKRIKKDVTVGLSGECADEVFGGYPWFHQRESLAAETFPWAVNIDHRLKVLSPELIRLIRPSEYLSYRYAEALAEIPGQSVPASSVPIPRDNLGQTARYPSSKGKSAQSFPVNTPEHSWRENRQREISYLTLTRFMPTLLDRKDRMTMAAGLEVRVPFCDHRLIEYVWNIPWDMKAYGGREKGLLRQALTGILPEDVLWRRKSPYPKTHNPSYLKAVRSCLAEILHDPNSRLLPLVNIQALEELMKISDSLPAGHPWFGQLMDTPQLFAYLIQVEIWLRSYRVTLV